MCVIVTGFFNAAQGLIPVAILFHCRLNMPTRPDAHTRDMSLFVVLALRVVWTDGRAMVRRAGAVTGVIPGVAR